MRSNIRPYNINLGMETRGYKPGSLCPNRSIIGQCNQKLQASGMKFVVCCNGRRYNRWSPATEEEKKMYIKSGIIRNVKLQIVMVL